MEDSPSGLPRGGAPFASFFGAGGAPGGAAGASPLRKALLSAVERLLSPGRAVRPSSSATTPRRGVSRRRLMLAGSGNTGTFRAGGGATIQHVRAEDRLRVIGESGDKRGAASFMFMVPLFCCGIIKMTLFSATLVLLGDASRRAPIMLQTAQISCARATPGSSSPPAACVFCLLYQKRRED